MHLNAKKILKALIAIVLAPIVLFILLTVLLYIPPVQNWVAHGVADYATSQTGDSITVGHVSLSFPLDLEVSDFRMLHPNDSLKNVTDTVADVRTLVASVQFLPLLKGKVNVDELTFKHLKANTANFIGDLRIKGNLEKLHVHSHGIMLNNDSAKIDFAEIENGWLDVALGDTVPKDTTKEKTLWKINIDKVTLSKTDFRLHLPGDSMTVHANFHSAIANNAQLLLHDNMYKVEALDWHGGDLDYDLPYKLHALKGFDSNHISASDINLGVDSFVYSKPDISVKIRAANFKEHSGLVVRDMSGGFLMDDKQLRLSDFRLKMPMTDIGGKFWMDMNAFDDVNPGHFFADLDGKIGVSDLNPFLVSVPKAYLSKLPHESLNVKGRLYGNLNYLSFRNLTLGYPSAFTINGNGYAANLTKTDKLKASARLSLTTRNMAFVKKFMPASSRKTINIPSGLNVKGFFKIDKKLVETDFAANYSGGSLKAKGFFNGADNRYNVTANARNFKIGDIVRGVKLGPLSGFISARGKGTDFPSAATSLALNTRIDKFRFGKYTLDGIKGNVRMSGGRIDARVNSHNPMVGGNIHVNGRLAKNSLDVHLSGNVSRANLLALGVMDKPWMVSARPNLRIKSNFDNYYYACGTVDNLYVGERGRRGMTKLVSGNHLFVDGSMRGNAIEATVNGDIDDANLRGLGVIDKNYFVSTNAKANIKGNIKKPYLINLTADANTFDLVERRDTATIPLVSGNFLAHVNMKGNNVNGSFDGLISEADLYQLGVVDEPFKTMGSATLAFSSDMKEKYYVNGHIDDMAIIDKSGNYTTSNLGINILSTADTTHADITGGDFTLKADARGSYKTLLKAFTSLSNDLQAQIKNKEINQSALKAKLPVARLVLNTGSTNILSSILSKNGIKFKFADIDLTSSPVNGLNGTAILDSLVYNDVVADSINLALKSENGHLNYDLAILNNASNSYPYKGYLSGTVYEKGIQAMTKVIDDHDKTALDVALQAAMEGEGINLSITSPRSILGYKEFAVNDSNYVYIGKDRRVSANMKLLADDGAGAQLYTDDEDTTSLQNITLGMHNFELGKLLTVLPFAPKISGVLDGDYHVIQTADELTVSSDMTVKNMIYDDCPMGNVGMNLVYMPQGDGTHYVDAIISQDGRDVGQLSGTYDSKDKGNLDASLSLDKFPLDYINGFVPDRIIGLNGTGEGELSVKGPLDNLDINGEVYLDSSYLFSEPYGIQMRFADDPVTIKNSRLLFENFEMFANNDQPLDIAGYLDFHDPSNMYIDTRMRAENFKLIDSKETARSTIYGDAYVNFFGGLRGYMDNLRMGGRIEVLGNTDMTYVMRDTPLSTDDTPDDLIKFTNFNDSTPDVIVRPTIKGLQMDLSVSIDEQAHVVAALNAEHTNYIDLIGGGDLIMHYDPTNDMTLRGRYTLNSGQMKYSLDMIPLRTFNIQEGSYIEFTGEPMNPTLNITATESVKANYSSTGGNDRLVNFTAGVKLTNTLSSPTVEFIVDAPDDTEAQNDLNTKSKEEKGKIAVTLLASGMYISNGKMGNYAMSGALASFMQNQINSVTGRALSSMGLDLSANMESSADATGALHTDYTFNFSKRLWNNRLRIMMGGRVSTGSSAGEDNGAYFDNFSMEYRLNQRETQYLKLYYERQAYDWLEGDISEFGAGFMWRRKLQHFKDIFNFKSEKSNQPAAPAPRLNADTLIRFNSNGKK